MRHRTTQEFRKLYDELPQEIKELANKNFELLKKDPLHPSLHFKKVGKLWSVRIGDRYRALALKDGDEFIWFWIGTHEEYNLITKRV